MLQPIFCFAFYQKHVSFSRHRYLCILLSRVVVVVVVVVHVVGMIQHQPRWRVYDVLCRARSEKSTTAIRYVLLDDSDYFTLRDDVPAQASSSSSSTPCIVKDTPSNLWFDVDWGVHRDTMGTLVDGHGNRINEQTGALLEFANMRFVSSKTGAIIDTLGNTLYFIAHDTTVWAVVSRGMQRLPTTSTTTITSTHYHVSLAELRRQQEQERSASATPTTTTIEIS